MLMAVAVVAAVLSAEPGLAALDEKNGFRDLKFGTKVEDVPGLKFLGQPSVNERLYERPSDGMRMGDAYLTSIIYGFYKGRFSAVMVSTEGYDNFRAVLLTFSAAYGPGKQLNPYIENYFWRGHEVIGMVRYSEVTREVRLTLSSVALKDERDRDERNKAAAASADL